MCVWVKPHIHLKVQTIIILKVHNNNKNIMLSVQDCVIYSGWPISTFSSFRSKFKSYFITQTNGARRHFPSTSQQWKEIPGMFKHRVLFIVYSVVGSWLVFGFFSRLWSVLFIFNLNHTSEIILKQPCFQSSQSTAFRLKTTLTEQLHLDFYLIKCAKCEHTHNVCDHVRSELSF